MLIVAEMVCTVTPRFSKKDHIPSTIPMITSLSMNLGFSVYGSGFRKVF